MKKGNSAEELMLLFIAIVVALIGAVVFLIIRVNRIEFKLTNSMGTGVSLGLTVGKEAPTFKIATIDGIEFDSESAFSKNTMLVFSSPKCHFCQELFPDLKEFVNKYPTLETVMISSGTKDEIKEMVLDYNFNFPIAEWNQDIAGKYEVPGTPFVYFILKGKIISAGVPGSLEDLEKMGESLILK